MAVLVPMGGLRIREVLLRALHVPGVPCPLCVSSTICTARYGRCAVGTEGVFLLVR